MQALNYTNKVKKLINEENGRALAPLLSLQHSHTKNLLDHNIQPSDYEKLVRNKMEAPWNEVIVNHIKTLVHLDEGSFDEAFETQKELVQAFQRGMANMTRWCLPILYIINNELRIIATKADLHSTTAVEGQRKKLEEAANVISKSFTYCITDRGILSTSKKYGTYCMIGILFRIYFKLKQQNLCKNILRAVKAADMPPLEEFPKSDRVTFRYYLGRLYFLEEDYAKAETELILAFKECTNRSIKNKELILQILLPVKLMRGILPTDKLFAKFPKARNLYGGVATAIRRGDVKRFNESLVEAESRLIRQGTYFAIEKSESIAIRQLFRKVYLVLGSNTRIPIGTFQKALAFEGLNVEIEETEWMLANMIFKGYMKGYLSHEKMFLVLSKGDPFPRISQLV